MEKRWRFMLVFFVILAVIAISIVIFYFNKSIYGDVIKERWGHMPLTYYTNFSGYNMGEVIDRRNFQVKYALERVHSAVPSIVFEKAESPQKADLIFYGEIPLEIRKNNSEGLGPLGEVVGLIVPEMNGENFSHVDIYLPLPTLPEKQGLAYDCPNSDIALHELLHALGIYRHSNADNDVMTEVASCNERKIVREDINTLKRIYG